MESGMYLWQLWRSKNIVNLTSFQICVYVFYKCIVKNRVGNGCGTSHLSKKYQHSWIEFLITFTLRYSTMKQKIILI